MKIEIIEPFGYCAGVANAIKLAGKVKQSHPTENVCVLGMLVHNQDALNDLSSKGILTIYKKDKTLIELIDEIPEGSIVILTAHGHGKEVEDKLTEKGFKFIDTTCPFVTQTEEQIRKAINAGRDVIYLGKRNHPEANAACSISSKVHLVDPKNPQIDGTFNHPLLISQTTFSQNEINNAINDLQTKVPGLEIVPSICHASTTRQNALINLSEDVELIYVVGGLDSNNTKTLFEIAKQTHPNAKVLAIQNKNDINKKDLNGLSYIAISSGASTPREITLEIEEEIKLLLN